MSNNYYGYPNNNQNQPPYTQPPKKRGGAVALIIALCVLMIGLGGVVGLGISYLTSSRGGSSTPQANLPSPTPAATETQTVIATETPEPSEEIGGNTETPESTDNQKHIYTETDGTTEEMKSEDVAALVSPSVVSIQVTTIVTQYGRKYEAQAAGSGVIISSDGYIVTNYHVISNSKKVTVNLNNGVSYDAKVVGYNQKQDLALIKIKANNLQAIKFGKTEDVKLGQNVMVIGNPLGVLAGSVSGGYISALEREVVVDGQPMTYMQTDAAINQGNSGGALVNMKGELIGIVSAKTIDIGVEGLGYAIPIAKVKEVIDDIVINGHRATPSFGITLIQLDSDAEAAVYFLNGAGVYVGSVDPGSPAEEAGIQVRDKIISIDGEEISTTEQVAVILDKHNVGDVLLFVIERDFVQYRVEIRLTAMDLEIMMDD